MGIRAFGILASAEKEARFPRCACPALSSLAGYVEHAFYTADKTYKYAQLDFYEYEGIPSKALGM